MAKNVAVIGGGYDKRGEGLATYLSMKGCKVNLFEFPEYKENLESVKKLGGMNAIGELTGFAKIDVATTDIKEALEGVELIIPIVVSWDHKRVSELCSPLLRDGQTVFFIGEPGGALELAKAMKTRRIRKDIVIGETNTMTGGGRVTGPNEARIGIRKGGYVAAAFPAKNNSKLVKTVKEFWPPIEPVTNVFETMLLNFNAIDHFIGLFNIGVIEGAPGEINYWEVAGLPSGAKCIKAVADETLSLRKALGFKDLAPYKDWRYRQGMMEKVPKTTYESLQGSRQMVKNGPTFYGEHRFITESIPYGNRLICSLGDYIGVDTPFNDLVVTLASTVNGADYWKDGRTLDDLGVPKGLSVKELNKFLYEGES